MLHDKLSSSRRQFMKLLLTAAASYPLSALADNRRQSKTQVTEPLQDPWLTIAEVQQHLFPADEDSPGASDIKALDYLRNMIQAADIDPEEREFITNGEQWLNGIARKVHNKAFVELDLEQKEAVLRRIEGSRAGENWLSSLLRYLIEALLSDPVYGGNPDGIGWAWLKHQPGYPTPSTEKMYYKLGKSSYRRTKA